MSFDITFCSYKGCKEKNCERHLTRLKGWLYPVSIADFTKCENWKDGLHSIRIRKEELLKGE